MRESIAPSVREAPAAGAPLDLGGPAATASAATGPTIVGTGVAMLDQPREQFNAALQPFKPGNIRRRRTGSRRSWRPIRPTG